MGEKTVLENKTCLLAIKRHKNLRRFTYFRGKQNDALFFPKTNIKQL